MRGMLLSFSDPRAGIVPTPVPFQYNPSEVTRVLRPQAGTSGGSGLRVAGPPTETYTVKLELDALDAPDKPLTGTLGVGPLLATLESMLEPGGGGTSGLVGAVAGLLAGGGSPTAVPVPTLPLVILAWSIQRMVPVRIETYTAHETGFDATLQPVQATVDLSLTVLRPSDVDPSLTLSTVMAAAYQTVRQASAVAGVAQGLELMV
jgi:hypothetical protein